LPDILPAGRKDAAQLYLDRAAANFLPAERAEIVRQILTILNDLIFTEAFAPGSRAEVPIVGRIARAGAPSVAVSGRVDRLAVTRDAVLIVDYKSDRIVPRGLAEVPTGYVDQLVLYGAVLARIYPEKTIRAALLFTERPVVIEVPGVAAGAALAEALGRLTLR
jgi:ATP-dependent helicase/nuclease subunit A